MTEYYHQVDELTFQHQLADVVDELEFRMEELISAGRDEVEAFHKTMSAGGTPDDSTKRAFNYRFGSALGLIQTFRDALAGALSLKKDELTDLEAGLPHADLFRNLRNALVHDGYQPLGMWIDGHFYLPVGISRNGPGGKPVLIPRPAENIETLWLQYVSAFANKLATQLEELPPERKLNGPQRDYDWFLEASNHPALTRYNIKEQLPARENWPAHAADAPRPLDKAAIKLRDIASLCDARLHEIACLPAFPFP